MPKKKSIKKTTKSEKTKTAKPEQKAKKVKKTVIQSPKGVYDVLPVDQPRWDLIRREVEKIAERYNFGRIETPVIERAELFEKTVGEATDIVEKQMFFLKNTKDRMVLRPENTAGVMRAYIEHGLSHLPQPARFYYFGPMFRHEQPQRGRFRQFFQVGFEVIGGISDAVYDAQTILIFYRLLESLKIGKMNVQVNSVGCRSCRAVYRRRLVDYYKDKKVCRDCKKRLSANPLRLLDCKGEKCKEIKEDAPVILDSICEDCNCHFRSVLEYLESVSVPYNLNHHLVRGLDYYNKTVFEIFSEDVDLALAGGGRYDYLMEMLGGASTPAVGGAIGLERLLDILSKRKISKSLKDDNKTKVFLIYIGNLAKRKGLILLDDLRKSGIRVNEAFGKVSLKAQLKQADKEGAIVSLIFGQKEAFEDSIIVRDMETGSQETIPLDKLIKVVKKKLK